MVLDNLRAQKSEATLALTTAAGAQTRFLPACSPELNLIGMMWSKVKTFLCSAEACSLSALLQSSAKALAAVTPNDARNWFAHCGLHFYLKCSSCAFAGPRRLV